MHRIVFPKEIGVAEEFDPKMIKRPPSRYLVQLRFIQIAG